jgi:hypothetical protein
MPESTAPARWWMDRELVHHTAEIAFVRDLYRSYRSA